MELLVTLALLALLAPPLLNLVLMGGKILQHSLPTNGGG